VGASLEDARELQVGHIFIFAQIVDGDFIFWAFRYEEVLNNFGMGARDFVR
jgi:hypothetical protein